MIDIRSGAFGALSNDLFAQAVANLGCPSHPVDHSPRRKGCPQAIHSLKRPRKYHKIEMFPGSSMVEHSAVNRRVASSNLARGAKFSFFLNYLQTAIFPLPFSAANCYENVTVLAFCTATCLSSPLLASPAQPFLTGSGASFRGLSGAWRSVRVLIRQSSLAGELALAEISTSRRDTAFRLRVCAVLRAGSLCVHSRIRLLRSRCLVEAVADCICAAGNRNHHRCPCS